MAGIYKISYSNPMGVKLVDSIVVGQFDLVRRVNEIGALTLSLANPAQYGADFFVKDGIIDVFRSVNGGPFLPVGETSWFISRLRYATDDSGVDITEIQAVDALDLVRRRIVAYDSGSVYSTKLDIADDLMKDVTKENYGALAIDTKRDISAVLSVEKDESLGAIVGDNIAWKRVGDVLRGFADASSNAGARIFYDVVRTGANAFELRTYKDYRGIDHTADSDKPVIVSRERKNLGSPELIYDYTESFNYVYAGGKGENGWRTIKEAEDTTATGASPYARTEVFVDASNVTDPDQLQTVANRALTQGRARIQFNGRILETPACMFGVHYDYGDLVTIRHRGLSLDCSVDALHVNVTRDQGEQLEILIRGDRYA